MFAPDDPTRRTELVEQFCSWSTWRINSTSRARVIVATARTMSAEGQNLLDDYLSSGTGQTVSLIDALEADKTLAGAVDDIHVSVGSSYGEVKWNETASYFGAELMVAVRVDRQ